MTNSQAASKKRVALEALEEQLQDQLAFLERSCAAFDDGYEDEFKRLAVTLRVLLHDTARSHSLLKLLDMKDGRFLAYSRPIDGRNLLPDWPLAIARLGSDGADLIPALAESLAEPRSLSFDAWWTETVYRDPSAGITLDRRAIVLATANKDGGAHVDPEVDEKYAHLTQQGPGLVAQTPVGIAPLEHLRKSASGISRSRR